MAATKVNFNKLSLNTIYDTKRKATPAATVSTAGTTFVVPTTDGLKDFSKFFLVLDTLGSSATATITYRQSTWGVLSGQGAVTLVVDSSGETGATIGSTNSVKILGPFESARFRTTGGGVDGFRFNIKATTGGSKVAIARLEAFGLPGAYSTYGA